MLDFYNVAVCCGLLIASLIAWLLYGIQSQLTTFSRSGSQPSGAAGPSAGTPPAADDGSLPLWLACVFLLVAPLVSRAVLQLEIPPYLFKVPVSDWTITTFFSLTAIGIVACFWIDHRTVLAKHKHMMHLGAIDRLKGPDEASNRVLRAIALQTADVQPRKDLVQ